MLASSSKSILRSQLRLTPEAFAAATTGVLPLEYVLDLTRKSRSAYPTSRPPTLRAQNVAGIRNLGNSCFFNTVLQSLATMKPFVDSLEKSVRSLSRRPSVHADYEMKLSRLVLEVLRCLQPTEQEFPAPISPHDLLRRLQQAAPHLQFGEQQDAEELLQILVNLLSAEFKPRRFCHSLSDVPPYDCLSPTPSQAGRRPKDDVIPFQNSLSGWLASTLQCNKCHYRRPVQHTTFIDIQLTLSEDRERKETLGGSAWLGEVPAFNLAGFHDVRWGQGNGDMQRKALDLTECLEHYVREEVVGEVDCQNCTKMERLGILQEKIDELTSTIETVQSKGLDQEPRRVDDVDALRHQLKNLQLHQRQLRYQDAEGLDLSSFTPTSCDSHQCHEGKLLKSPATKRLLISRLPKVLCLHLGRRVYNPAMNSMRKVTQRVSFPLIIDMAPYTAYGKRERHDILQTPLPNRGLSLHQAAHSLLLPLHQPLPAPYVSTPSSPSASTSSAASSLPTPPASPLPSIHPTMSQHYLLQSVIVHHGSADAGHYTTYRRLLEGDGRRLRRQVMAGLSGGEVGEWVHVNDECVQRCSVQEVLQSEAYMLFYQSLETL